jgi:hypothetical protein
MGRVTIEASDEREILVMSILNKKVKKEREEENKKLGGIYMTKHLFFFLHFFHRLQNLTRWKQAFKVFYMGGTRFFLFCFFYYYTVFIHFFKSPSF